MNIYTESDRDLLRRVDAIVPHRPAFGGIRDDDAREAINELFRRLDLRERDGKPGELRP